MADFQILAEGFKNPEGPVYMPDGDVVITEVATGKLIRITPHGKCSVLADVGDGPNGAAMGPGGKLYVCNNGQAIVHDAKTGEVGFGPGSGKGGRIQIVDPETGKSETLYDRVDGRALNGPNDLMFDRQGGFWFSDFGALGRHDSRHGGIYYGRADGSLIRCAAYPVFYANGIGLSPDGTKLYVAQTFDRVLLEFDITGPGEIAPVKPYAPGRVIASFPGRTCLDSLAITADGDVCIGTVIEGRGVAQVTPSTGTIVYRSFPDHSTTNICFGGADMRQVWVTMSGTGRVATARWDKPGLRLAY